MKCLFCKEPSDRSTSQEHIVPESLGNKSHVLVKGVVCDKCNNYIATKIEKTALETPFFKDLRFRNNIESKKGKIPSGTALFPKTKHRGEISFDMKSRQINVQLDEKTFNLVNEGVIKQVYIPYNLEIPTNNQAVSRMLAKIALEFTALNFAKTKEELALLVDEEQLDPIRNYVRFNPKNETWVYHTRKIYDEHENFFLADGKSVDMVFECDFLMTENIEVYFIIAFKGVEFVINMAGSSVDGYLDWLKQHNNVSPLYRKGRHFGYKLTPEFLIKDKSHE